MKTHLTRLTAAALLAAGSLAATVPFVYADDEPVASFTVTPSSPVTGEQVTFRSTSTGSIRQYRWDLDNDGSYDDGSAATVTYTFTTAGTKTVRLRVTGDDGDRSYATRTFTVTANRAPVASFSGPAEVDTGQQATFTSSSSDPDGRPLANAWDLDNDGSFDDGTGSSASTSFAANGTRTIRLRVTDSGGAQAIATRTLVVRNRLPTAAFNASATEADTGQPISFSSTSSDPDGSIASHAWDFDGDGTTDASGANVTNSFPDDGTFAVKLTVTDDDGGSRTATRQVTIRNRAPSAGFTYAPAAPMAGESVQLTSTAADPDGTVAQREWDLDNDGDFDDATGASVSATFPAAGSYQVGHRSVDDDGAAAASFETIDVAARPPEDDGDDGDGGEDGGGGGGDSGTGGTGAGGTGGGAGSGQQTTATALIAPRLLAPFPRVRIKGMTTMRGVRIDMLSVRTPGATRILVTCKGRGCPYKRRVVRARFRSGVLRVVKLPGFRRRNLRAGAVIRIYVTRPNTYGKYTRFDVRGRLKQPKRVDRCTAAGVARARKCTP